MKRRSPNRFRILVVGASGFIGSHVLKLAQRRGYQTAGTQSHQRDDDLITFRLGRERILDCLDSSFLETNTPLLAIHCATYSSLDRCYLEREASWRVNVLATQQLMRDLDAAGFHQVYLSSSFVFDGGTGDYCEDDPCAPISEYGRQKLAMERWIRKHLAEWLVLRLDKVIGSDPEEKHLLSEWWHLAESGSPIVCIKGQRFCPTLVDDVALGILTACEHGLRGVFHLASGEPFRRDQLARQFVRMVQKRVDVVEATQNDLGLADRRPEQTCLDSSRFNQRTGFTYTSMKDVLQTFARLVAMGGSP